MWWFNTKYQQEYVDFLNFITVPFILFVKLVSEYSMKISTIKIKVMAFARKRPVIQKIIINDNHLLYKSLISSVWKIGSDVDIKITKLTHFVVSVHKKDLM